MRVSKAPVADMVLNGGFEEGAVLVSDTTYSVAPAQHRQPVTAAAGYRRWFNLGATRQIIGLFFHSQVAPGAGQNLRFRIAGTGGGGWIEANLAPGTTRVLTEGLGTIPVVSVATDDGMDAEVLLTGGGTFTAGGLEWAILLRRADT